MATPREMGSGHLKVAVCLIGVNQIEKTSWGLSYWPPNQQRWPFNKRPQGFDCSWCLHVHVRHKQVLVFSQKSVFVARARDKQKKTRQNRTHKQIFLSLQLAHLRFDTIILN